jgi:hypothetical protein
VIGDFDDDHNSRSVRRYNILLTGRRLLYIQFMSSVTTFDILVKFTNLSAKTLEELHDRLDNPSNGMILEKNAHYAFNSFDWCLKQTEVSFMTPG